jgi:drug/metabolite transporter (DMT)-like permease
MISSTHFISTSKSPKTLWSLCALIAAVALWGGSFTIVKHGVHSFPAMTHAFLSFFIAFVVLQVGQWITRFDISVPKHLRKSLILSSLSGITLSYGIENVALQFTNAGNAALFSCSSPLLLIVGSVLFFNEKLNLKQLLGIGLAFVSMFMLLGASFSHTGLGDGLMFVNMLLGAYYSFASRELAQEFSPLKTLYWNFAIGNLGFVPLVLFELFTTTTPVNFTFEITTGLIYLAIGCSLLAYGMWLKSLKDLSMTTVGLIMCLMPVFTLVFSSFFANEPITMTRTLEAFGIIIGVFIASGETDSESETVVVMPGLDHVHTVNNSLKPGVKQSTPKPTLRPAKTGQLF